MDRRQEDGYNDYWNQAYPDLDYSSMLGSIIGVTEQVSCNIRSAILTEWTDITLEDDRA